MKDEGRGPMVVSMRPQHLIALTLALGGCKAAAVQQIEDPSLPIMVFYSMPG